MAAGVYFAVERADKAGASWRWKQLSFGTSHPWPVVLPSSCIAETARMAKGQPCMSFVAFGPRGSMPFSEAEGRACCVADLPCVFEMVCSPNRLMAAGWEVINHRSWTSVHRTLAIAISCALDALSLRGVDNSSARCVRAEIVVGSQLRLPKHTCHRACG
jgi:hypothetical protein